MVLIVEVLTLVASVVVMDNFDVVVCNVVEVMPSDVDMVWFSFFVCLMDSTGSSAIWSV